MDGQALKDSFARVASHGDEVPLFFYSHLFVTCPETRDMFPVSMANQRDKLVAALGRVVSDVDNVDALVPFLQQLGRDHRKFGVEDHHYPAVGTSLLATLRHFLGSEWTPELERDWTEAYGIVSQVMAEAAAEAAKESPAWWNATVIEHERRNLDVAVLHLETDEPLPYTPGQSLAVETAWRPRLWRYYSPANAPRGDGRIELHVRRVDGGQVSSALLQSVARGDQVRLGAPMGDRLTLDPQMGRDLLLIAGGTGLAPLRAIIEQVSREPVPRHVDLFLGARKGSDFYDLSLLERLQQSYPWLAVTPVASDDPRFSGERGLVGDIALNKGPWAGREIYVCGSPEMVAGTRVSLLHAGVTQDCIHHEDFGGNEGGTSS